MRKKHTPQPETPVVDQEIIRRAKASLKGDRPATVAHCVICGAEAAPTSTENLCWVCRRLKISAWRDNEQQPNAQE